MDKKIVILDYKKTIETEDGLLYNYIYELSDDFCDNFPNIHYIRRDISTESYPVKIETVEKMLSELKDKGSNYVEIDFHCDHGSYIMSGLDIRVADEKETEEYMKSSIEKKRKEIIKKIDDAKILIDKLNKELNKF